MDVLYIPQLDEIGTGGEGEGGGGSGGGTAARYRILRRVPEDGVVVLTDRAVTRVDIATDGGSLRLVVPPEAKGTARDFFVRLVITADEIPEVIFAAPTGEAISFEDVDDDVFKCETGVNVFAFTETDAGIFIVNRKQIDIDQKPTRGLSPMACPAMACPVWAARLHCGTLRNEIHPSPGRRSVEREGEISLRKKYVGPTNGESNKLTASSYFIVNIT